jgi:hypothetical protein
MSGYSAPTRENDAVQTVRTIGRVAQMLIELRDEYTERRREDTLQQIEQRLDDLVQLHAELKQKIAEMHSGE